MSGYQSFQLVVVVLMGALWGLAILSRRRPDIEWLQPFRTMFRRPSEEERQRLRRRGNRYAGIELILFGLIMPMGYVALTVMMFNDFTPLGLTIVTAGSLLCIGLGVTAIWQNRR